MGDFPTLALFRVFAAALFFGFLTVSPELGAGFGGTLVSDSSLSGELEVVADIPMSNRIIESDWACSAGEVRGLKYALGTAKCWSMGNWLSSGVTAGETSGVKDICRVCQQGSRRLMHEANFQETRTSCCCCSCSP